MTQTAISLDPLITITPRQKWLLVTVFGIYLALIISARQFDPTPTGAMFPVLLTVYIGLIVAPLLVLRTSLGWFHPIVFSSILRLLDLVRRFAMYSRGLEWHIALPATPDELSELLEFQLQLHLLGVGSYYFGFFLGPRLPVPSLGLPTPKVIVPALLAIIGVALVAFAIFILGRGGLSAHIASWSLGRREQLAGETYWITLANLGVPACWLWLAYRRNAPLSPLFWASVVTSLAVSFLAAGSRGTVVYAVVIGVFVWMLRVRRVSYVVLLVGAVLALYAIGALGAFRRSTWTGSHDWQQATELSFYETVTSGGAGELQDRSSTGDGALPIYARVPNEVGLLGGDSYLAVLTLPVPRGLWPDKPTLVDGRVGATFFHSYAGIPPGAVGEAYWNFHIPGVIVVFFMFGVFHRWAMRTFLAYAERPAMMVFYASALLIFREPASMAFVAWTLVMAPLVIMLVLLGGLRLRS